MTPEKQSVTERARESAERAAYAAIGAPTAAIKGLNARMSDLKDALKASRAEMTDELADEMETWVAEGEQVIERAMEKIRSSNVTSEIRSSADSTRRAVRVGLDKAIGKTESGLQLLEPEEPLTTIKGVGPGYADRLRQAGVSGIADFLTRTATSDGIDRLASESDMSRESLEGWRSQVDLSVIDGVGESYQLLLHRVGVWTLDQLASASPDELSEAMRSMELPDAPDQIPTESVVRKWKSEARRLTAAK